MNIIEKMYDQSKYSYLVYLIDLETWEVYVGPFSSLCDLLRSEKVLYLDNILNIRGRLYVVRLEDETVGFSKWNNLDDLQVGLGTITRPEFKKHDFMDKNDEFVARADLAWHKVFDEVSRIVGNVKKSKEFKKIKESEHAPSNGKITEDVKEIPVKKPKHFTKVEEAGNRNIFISPTRLFNYFWLAILLTVTFVVDFPDGFSREELVFYILMSISFYFLTMYFDFKLFYRNDLDEDYKSLINVGTYYNQNSKNLSFYRYLAAVGVVAVLSAIVLILYTGSAIYWLYCSLFCLSVGILLFPQSGWFNRFCNKNSIHSNGGVERWLYVKYLRDELIQREKGYIDLGLEVMGGIVSDLDGPGIVDLSSIHLPIDVETGFLKYFNVFERSLSKFYNMFRTLGINFILYEDGGEYRLRFFLDGRD